MLFAYVHYNTYVGLINQRQYSQRERVASIRGEQSSTSHTSRGQKRDMTHSQNALWSTSLMSSYHTSTSLSDFDMSPGKGCWERDGVHDRTTITTPYQQPLDGFRVRWRDRVIMRQSESRVKSLCRYQHFIVRQTMAPPSGTWGSIHTPHPPTHPFFPFPMAVSHPPTQQRTEWLVQIISNYFNALLWSEALKLAHLYINFFSPPKILNLLYICSFKKTVEFGRIQNIEH